VSAFDVEQFIQLETTVWQALVDGDPAADAAALSDDFLGVYPSGFAGRTEHAGQLDGGPTMLTYDLSQARLFVVSDVAVMLSYRADYTRPGRRGGPPEAGAMYISSLWCDRDGGWINVFSQDTPVAEH